MGPLATRRKVLNGLVAMPASLGIGAAMAGPLPRCLPRQGRYVGAAVTPELLLSEPAFRRRLVEDCDCITPEVHLKWEAIEWRPGKPWYANVDALAGFARLHGMQMRGHTLLWHRTTPAWAAARIESGDWAPVERHFANVIPRYSDVVREWDVVNEPIDTENGEGGLRRSVFHKGFGAGYIERALWTAHAAAPAARLMLNDYSLEYDNPVDEARRTAMLKLAEHLLARRAPLGGIGIQAHLDLAKGRFSQPRFARFLEELRQLGLHLSITELDVREADRRLAVDQRDRLVAAEVESFLGVALANPAVAGVVTWGLSDRHSWLQQEDDQTRAALLVSPPSPVALNRGLPYDARFAAKPMQQAIARALRAEPAAAVA